MKISLVTSLYNSSPYLEDFYTQTKEVLNTLTSNHEIILVNDASPDNSLEIALQLRSVDSKLKIIDLSRNFGQHKALMAGLKYSTGDIVFAIDSDLEENPESILTLHAEFRKNNKEFDLIYGVQATRKGGLFERLSGKAFYALFNYMIGLKAPQNSLSLRLMTRRFVDSLCLHQESDFFMHGISLITGFKQKAIEIKKVSTSPTSYSLTKKIDLSLAAITSFSTRPLILISKLGVFISLCAFMYLIQLVIRYFLYGNTVEGWSSIIASVWLLGGITIFFIGVIGIYLAKVFHETKNRPFTIIKAIYE